MVFYWKIRFGTIGRALLKGSILCVPFLYVSCFNPFGNPNDPSIAGVGTLGYSSSGSLLQAVEPNLNMTLPASPSQSRIPIVVGEASANARVELYSDQNCTTLLASGEADDKGDFEIEISVARQQKVEIYARAITDETSWSDCTSEAIEYTNISISEGIAFVQSSSTTLSSNANPAAYENLAWNIGEVDAEYYAHTVIGENDFIEVKIAGDYFLSLTMPLQSAVQRPCVEAEVTVNGAPVLGAVARSSYIRNFAVHSNSSNHLAFLLEGLKIGDKVRVRVHATAVAGQVNFDGPTSLYLEYISASRDFFSASSTRTVASTNLNGASASALQWMETRKDGSFGHSDSMDSDQITLVQPGNYLLFVNVPFSGTPQRGAPEVEVTINGATVLGGVAAQGYIRNDSGHSKSSAHWSGLLYNVPQNSVLKITTKQEARSGTMTVGTQRASLVIERLTSDDGVYSGFGSALTGGNNWNPTSPEQIVWSSDLVQDIRIYQRPSTTEISVREPGDYLVIYNDSFSSSVERPNPVVQFAVNGLLRGGAITQTHYMRGLDGHQESSGSLVFLLRGLVEGDRISVEVVGEAVAGTVNDRHDTILSLVKK